MTRWQRKDWIRCKKARVKFRRRWKLDRRGRAPASVPECLITEEEHAAMNRVWLRHFRRLQEETR